MLPLDVLIVDDEKNIRITLAMCLEGLGCHVVQAPDAKAALAAVDRRPRDLAFLDLRLGEASGLEVLPELLRRNPGLDVVMITAHGTIQSAVEAVQRGAREFLPKPFTPDQIREVVERAAARRAAQSDLERRDSLDEEASLTTESQRMRGLLERLDKAARHEVPILLLGEHGSGTSLLARRVHRLSPRADKPFVVIHCPTLSDAPVQAPAGGTLFLDEIGELSPALQARLLRVLVDDPADVRVVAASHRDLRAEADAGRFRRDLLFCLDRFELNVPPLRERQEDIAPLARRFLGVFARRAGRALELSREAEAAIVGHSWPGNLRELRNTMERAAILAPGTQVGVESLPERIVATSLAAPFLGGDFAVEDIEREHILRVVERHQRLDEAARVLGMDTSTLWRKRKKYEG
jgi:NtrC-family two-component system response regulator AlgB